ncbi:GNAT family N-acetyltransferase [Planosporangium sp. 12N6]|uniref:GNAT family N-acetyltransferase n=1 Tax=Planosporangium spinosum TaxID=3402278 RepID=UPI003CFADEE4
MTANPATDHDIHRATPGDVDLLAGMVARAFHDLPVSSWLVPDPAHRRRVLTADFAMLIAHALDAGEVHTTASMLGVAVWLPADPTPPLDIPDYDQRLARIAGEHLSRFRQFDATLRLAHPSTIAHSYLQLLAVEPGHHNRGVGTALLDHAHRRLDAAQLPAYLEASSLDSARLYRRHGYQPYGPPIVLGERAAEMYPMWRPPRQAPATR